MRSRLLELSTLAGACLIAAVPAPATAQKRQPFDHAGLASQVLERHIRPGYERLADAAAGMRAALERYCAAPSPDGRRALEAAFDPLVSAWGRIEHINFGPVTADNRLERMLFWPDRQGIGARQVARAIAWQDPGVLDGGGLSRKSVALQGLGALERVLFDGAAAAAPAQEAAFRCRFAAAIAGNMEGIAREVRDGWSHSGGFAADWLAPGPGNNAFLEPAETTLALAKAYDQALERLREERIGGPLALNAQRRRLPAVLGTSGRTLRLIAANIQGLYELFIEGGLRSAIVATDVGHPSINVAANADLIAGELASAAATAKALVSVRDPFNGEAARRQLISLGFPLKNARVQAAALLTLSAGLTLGFNSSDGD